MPKPALLAASAATLTAALAVPDQRVGLALSVVLLALLATAVATRPGAVDRPLLALAAVLALQPTLRDAGWVVVPCVVAAIAGGALAVRSPSRWRGVLPTVAGLLVLPAGVERIATALRDRLPVRSSERWRPVGRGAVAAVGLVVVFGALFASADPAFADLGRPVLDVGSDPMQVAWRVVLGASALALAGTLSLAASPSTAGPRERPPITPGAAETTIAVAALVGLFAVFVVVQLPVLFGGAERVRTTAGLGYGDDARAGVLQLVVVAVLTLGVVGVAARRPERTVRLLLGVLCVLTLVVLISAGLRVERAVDAYGLTRVRLGGRALLLWLGAVFVLVLAAGARPGVAARAPRIAVGLSLAAVLAFSLVDPDGQIAASVRDRVLHGRPVDAHYVRGLSADALPELRRIPRWQGGAALRRPVERRLERPDGVAGFNVARWRAR